MGTTDWIGGMGGESRGEEGWRGGEGEERGVEGSAATLRHATATQAPHPAPPGLASSGRSTRTWGLFHATLVKCFALFPLYVQLHASSRFHRNQSFKTLEVSSRFHTSTPNLALMLRALR